MNDDVAGGIDPLYDNVGRIVNVTLAERSFKAKLVSIIGQGIDAELWFERTDGERWAIKRRTVLSLNLVKGKVI